MEFEKLKDEPRLLLEAELKPLQGTRFQPTGFPDIGAATYQTVEEKPMLLVESAQSMANRMEAVCWDASTNSLPKELSGLPYISVVDETGRALTSSLLESHRINSPYILESGDTTFFEALKKELGVLEKGRVDMKLLAKTLFKYDPNSLLHGVFLAKKELAGGRLRVPRSLSAFIEASDVKLAASGGVKRDDVNPSGNTKAGFGHVPFARDEYTGRIKASFNIDLAQIRGYGLGKDAEQLLIALSLYKIQKVLREGLRLRTACDLETQGNLTVGKHSEFKMPSLEKLGEELPKLIAKCSKEFADPTVTVVKYVERKASKSKKGDEDDSVDETGGNSGEGE